MRSLPLPSYLRSAAVLLTMMDFHPSGAVRKRNSSSVSYLGCGILSHKHKGNNASCIIIVENKLCIYGFISRLYFLFCSFMDFFSSFYVLNLAIGNMIPPELFVEDCFSYLHFVLPYAFQYYFLF